MNSLKAEEKIIQLDRHMLAQLMKGGLEKLMWEFGEGAVVINIVRRTLEVVQVEVEDVKSALLRFGAAGKVENVDGTQSCPVCYCDVTNPVFLDCGHVYCKECLTHMLLATSPASPSAKCIHELDDENLVCQKGIHIRVIRDLLRPEQEQELFHTAFLGHVHSRPEEFRYCPTPDCNVIYRPADAGTVLTCPSCLNRICPACHIQFHEGLTCVQHRDNMEGGNEKFQEWKKENGVKECPKCGANIQKSAGCNHMTCSRCQTHMCWICLKTFTGNTMDSAGGVYHHITKMHGNMD